MIPNSRTGSVRKSTSPQWDDIRYFLEVARSGSLSGAARAMKVEHSTVARRVEALEHALSVRLFDRLPRRWQPTAEGVELLAQAERLEREALTFERVAQGFSSFDGKVRISAPPVFASHYLASRLPALRTQYPTVTLELVGETRDADLSSGDADLALRLSRPRDPDLAARSLGDMRYGLYATPDYLERPEQAWEFLGYDESLDHVPQQRWLHDYAGARPLVLLSNDLGIVLHACLAGVGIAALPHCIVPEDAGVVAVPGIDCPVARPLYLVVHPDVRRSPRVKAVADALARIIDLD